MLLLKDLQELFDYVEPADENLVCYSYRIHALLLRACVEVEANCKAILKENGYSKRNKKGEDVDMNMGDYKKINTTHRLSSYQVKIPYWNGAKDLRSPFSNWSTGDTLDWYEAYNTVKHDRLSGFKEAKFNHLLDACCGVLVILSAQFGREDFSPRNKGLALVEGPRDGMESGIGGYFRVKFPKDWPKIHVMISIGKCLKMKQIHFRPLIIRKSPNTACTRRVGVCAFSSSFRGLRLVPLQWRSLLPPTRG